MTMVKYIKRNNAKVHAIKGGLVRSFAEFDDKFPEKDFVFIWSNGIPTVRKRK